MFMNTLWITDLNSRCRNELILHKGLIGAFFASALHPLCQISHLNHKWFGCDFLYPGKCVIV